MRMHSPTSPGSSANEQPAAPPRVPCASCAVPLRADQRYCLNGGTRHAAPRLDFTAFGRSRPQEPGTQPTTAGTPPELWRPTRRHTMVLAVVLLAVGIAGGAAIGPAPSSSLAGTQRASLLAESLGLVARERTAQTAPGHTETTTTTESPPAPTAIRVHRKHHKHLATQSASSSEAPGEEPASSEASGSQEQ